MARKFDEFIEKEKIDYAPGVVEKPTFAVKKVLETKMVPTSVDHWHRYRKKIQPTEEVHETPNLLTEQSQDISPWNEAPKV